MSDTTIVLSAVIIAKNEETLLPDCLKSVSFCDEVVVVDSGSSDRTQEVAQKAGAKVYERPFDNFAAQKNFAVASASGRWILSVDADERVSPELKKEILAAIDREETTVTAYRFPRINFIFGKCFREWGGAQDRPVRLFLKDKARFEGVVHESLRAEGVPGNLQNPLFHYSTRDAKDYFRKLNHYTDLEVRAQGARKGRPLARFAQTYFIKGGILNGREGFIFSVLSGYYEFVRHAKFREARVPETK